MDHSIRILHVDDDPSFRDMTAKFLRQETDQFEIIEAGRATEAQEQLHESAVDIDCIVSDYALPDMTGVELLETVREEYPDLPFVLFTGKGSEAVARDALRAGATDYLQKQSGTEQYDLLSNRIRNAVDQSRTQKRVVDLERVRDLVGNINQGLVRASSANDIETTVCELFSTSDPYVTACIAGVDTETMQIEPRTWSGADQEYFERLEMSVSDDTPGRQAPGGRAYHDREIAVSQDIRNDPQYEQWRDAALERGFESLAVVPLEYEDTLYGLLAIFASRPYAFDESEQQILAELGDDIAHALHSQSIERDLQRTNDEFRTVFNNAPVGLLLVDYSDGTFRYRRLNRHMEELSGLSVDEIRGKTPREAFGTEDGRKVEARYRECVEQREIINYTEEFEIAGERVVREGTAIPVADGDTVEQITVIVNDITEERQRKEQKAENERYRRKLYQITSAQLEDGEKLSRLLELGCERLGLENGHVTRIERDENRHRIEMASGSDFIQAGTVTDLDSTYCRKTATSDDILTVYNAPTEGWEDDPAYERWNIGCYIGGRIEVNNEFYGTLCFVDKTPRDTEFTQHEQAFVDLMARWVSHIFERRQHERQLREYETVVNTVPDGVYILDDDLEFRMVNDALVELTGYSHDELLGAHASLILDDEAIEAGKQNRERLQEGESEHEHLQTELKTAHGDTVRCEIRGKLLDSASDELPATVGIIRDVTEQHEREEELRRNERRFEAVFNDPNILAGVLDPDGTLLAANATSMEYVDEKKADILGNPFWETPWWSDEMRPVIKENIEHAAQGEYVDYEASLTNPNGEPYSVEGAIRPVTDESGNAVSLVVSARDITDRKEREEQLAESEARYRALAENFPNGAVFFFDDDLRYQIVSGSGFAPLDTGPEDLAGNTIYEVEPYSEETIEILEPVMQATLVGNKETIELSYEERVYQLRSVPIRDDGEVVAGIYITQDITEQREREEELQRQNERLEKFASVVSHDLRNPLNMVEGHLELAKTECDSEELVDAETALDRCQTLVDDLLTLAREGQSVAETETVSLGEIAKQSWATVETADATLNTDAEQTVVADRSRLQQLLENLLRNAIDHGGPDVTVEVGSLEDGFYVADDGPGIPEDDREQVFESAYSTEQDNTGFGLAIVSEIVDAHGWDVTVTESASGGARFEITGVETN